MKVLIFSILLSFSLFSESFAIDLNQVRKDYIASVNDSKKTDALCNQLQAVKKPNALLLAYLGSAQAIKAKHAWNPINKMSYLKQGFATIDKAVAKDPNQLEVRFLRFSLQYYVPAFLGYSKNLMVDKDKMIQIFRKNDAKALNIDKVILKNIVQFMIDSHKCTTEEIAVLRKVLVNG